jgi:8-oxo-dGTP pyrophosphatase MutT (NUDIX family)
MPKALSCGVLLINEHDELLLCHVTCATWWDIPKGGQDAGETPLATAVRETREETGIALLPGALVDLGRIAYRSDKSLYLFAARTTRAAVDPVRCCCTSHFRQPHTGALLPEMDGFAWVPFAEVGARCAKTMAEVLTERLSLTDIAARLPDVNPLA